MREILFIGHRIPFPPDRGDKIRSHHVLKALARLGPVHVATFADDDADFACEENLSATSASYKLVRRSRPLPVAGVAALLSRQPVSLAAFHDAALADYVREVLATRPIAAVYVFSGQMAQYVPADFSGRVVVDFVDVDSAKFEAYAAQARPPMAWLHAREARLLSAVEAAAARRAQVSLLISEAEAALFKSRLDAGPVPDVRVLGNGVDTAMFAPDAVAPEPRMRACGAPRIVFSGQMDYAPNADAALRVIDRILPRIRAVMPDATFHVVGRNPKPGLLARNGKDGCHVWGRVPDVRPWLAGADLALIPLEIARGVQNKVLEAMAMALPVVLTRDAATGIAADAGRHWFLADSDAELAAAVLDLAGDGTRARAMGQAARAQVIAHASWQAALAPLPGLLGWQDEATRDAA